MTLSVDLAPDEPRKSTQNTITSMRRGVSCSGNGPVSWADVMDDPDAYSVLIYLIRHRYNRRAICEVIRNYFLIKRILARETSLAENYGEHGNNGNAAHWSGALAVFPFRDIDQIGCSWMTGRDSSTPAEQLREMLSHRKMDMTMEDRFGIRLLLGGKRLREVRKG